jgi:hypothetical protein
VAKRGSRLTGALASPKRKTVLLAGVEQADNATSKNRNISAEKIRLHEQKNNTNPTNP